MRSNVQSNSLRTCWEDVDKETAGNDGILNNLMGLTGELHILYSGREINGAKSEADGGRVKQTCLRIG
jgi:hypothetical protein